MATKPETNLRTRIVKKLKEQRGGFWVVMHGSAMQTKGMPDILGCWQGRYVGLEVKQPGEGPTRLQTHRIEQITRAGGLAGVITSYEEAEALLDA
jgi:Holliday junction resolvase